MGVVRCFLQMVDDLCQSRVKLTDSPLEKLVANCVGFAYIGSRRTLKQAVLSHSKLLRERSGLNRCEGCPKYSDSEEEWARWWYGRADWDKDSGVFPDFVIAHEVPGNCWNGALIELKDSKQGSIASFNSTLPSAEKDVNRLADIVRESVRRYDFPLSHTQEYAWKRKCFYLVRTWASQEEKVRISLVQGTFFETLPNQDLLRQLWLQLLCGAGLTIEASKHVLDALASLEREEIAVSRHIEKASIKPRLRIMSEVEADANPHDYPEIPPKAVNLIVKPEIADEGDDNLWIPQSLTWFEQQADDEKVDVVESTPQRICLREKDSEYTFKVCCIHHKRNGRHLVLQYIHGSNPQDSEREKHHESFR